MGIPLKILRFGSFGGLKIGFLIINKSNMSRIITTILLIIIVTNLQAQAQSRWALEDEISIFCAIDQAELPYSDNIEMTGRKVAGIIHYEIDTAQQLSIRREIIFPQLRKYIKETDNKWAVYRAYLKDNYEDDILPEIYVGDVIFVPGRLKSIRIDGQLTFEHHPSSSGISLQRTFYPSTTDRMFYEKWNLKNESNAEVKFRMGATKLSQEDVGAHGRYIREVFTDKPAEQIISVDESVEFAIQMAALLDDEAMPKVHFNEALLQRQNLVNEFQSRLILETPEPVLNRLFAFSKTRAAENIFDSKMGIVHSPGGGRYYTGVWANDQAEYSGPFFPYLGYADGNLAALNAYKKFYEQMQQIPNYDKNLWASYEMSGDFTCCGTDRGDAAMIAYGGAHYLLALADEKIAKEYFPMIEWALEYSHRKLNAQGVVKSESDEMEGRIPTGSANLSTSSLYYGALLLAADLADALGEADSKGKAYREKAKTLRKNIDKYFGARVEGLETYKYFDTHQFLRHWICLPLVMGIDERKAATITALFDRLWTDNGVHVEKNSDNEAISKIFWDRGTLYALRGTFIAGATEQSLEKLLQFSHKRLLGDRVPYVVEAFPEGSMAHLSAESALYCRVLTEGLFGINPTGFSSFTLTPRLPKEWPSMALKKVAAFGDLFDIEVKRLPKGQLECLINKDGKVSRTVIEDGATIELDLKN